MFLQKGQAHDINMLYGLCHGLAAKVPGSNTYVNSLSIQGLVYNLYLHFPHDPGMDQASPFKKAAAFLCYWLAAKPLVMDPDPYPPVNVKFGLLLALHSLENAILKINGDDHTVNEPLQISRHSLLDIVDALVHCENPLDSFKFVSVLMEQIVYKTNPHCQYPDVFAGRFEPQ